MNYFRTALLLAALTGFFLVVGYLLGGQTGLVLALVVALGMNLFAYWNSDKMVLRMANAQEVGPNEAPELHGKPQRYTIHLNGPWCITFEWADGTAIRVDLEQYH